MYITLYCSVVKKIKNKRMFRKVVNTTKFRENESYECLKCNAKYNTEHNTLENVNAIYV